MPFSAKAVPLFLVFILSMLSGCAKTVPQPSQPARMQGESVTNIPYFEIAPDGDHYLPKSYKDAIKDMNSPLSASWYSNTRVQLSGYDSKLTKELL